MDPDSPLPNRREILNKILVAIMEGNADSVHFEPPSNITMDFPCIVYERDDQRTSYADNKPYRTTMGYQVTVIERNSDSEIPNKVAALPMCSHSRSFKADNLYHDVYSLFF